MAAPSPQQILGLAPGGSGAPTPEQILGITPGVTAAPAKKSGHGGILGGIENAAHWTASKAALAGHDLKSIPGGLIQLGEAGVHDVAQGYEHPLRVQKNPHLLPLVEGMAKSSATSIEHPLRDPFQTLVTVAPALKLAGAAALRSGAAVGAARAGEGVGGVVKAAAAKPDLGPRLIKSGDTQVHLQESTNPAMRLAQAGYDKVLQHALDTNPEGRIAAHAETRIGGSLDETARYQQRQREAPAVALDAIAKKLAPKLAKGERRVNQAALELTSVNTTPEAAAAYHLDQAAKGVDAARNTAVARLYQTVHDAGLLTTNHAGDVIVNAAEHPRLAQADLKLAQVQGRGDEILGRYGIRSADQLQAATDAPGKYRVGATYENPTPGKLGIKSQTELKAESDVNRLQALHDKLSEKVASEAAARAGPADAVIGGKVVGPGASKVSTTKGAVSASRDRLALLEAEHAKAIDEVAAGMFGPAHRSDVNFRTQQNVKAAKAYERAQAATQRRGWGATKSGAPHVPTVVEERRAAAEQAIRDEIAKNPGHPASQRWDALTSEIDQLRAHLNPDIGEKPAGLLTGPGRVVGTPSGGRLEKVGGALSIAKDRLESVQRAARGYTNDKGEFVPGREKPTGIIGGETAAPGRGHVSYASSEKRAPQAPAAGSSGTVVGEAKSPITSHANTGYNIQHGLVPEDVTGQAARKFRSIIRFVNTTERRNAAIQTGSDVRRSTRDVLVKVPGEEHAQISQALEEELGRSKPTTGTVDGLNAALDAYRESIVPGLTDNFAADAEHLVGTTAAEAAAARGLEAPEGYKWVSRNALGDLAKPGINARPNKFGRGVDNINTAVTSATVYFKLGHIGTRFVTNATTNILQGSATPLQIGKSAELWKVLTPEEKAQALAVSGQHSFAALPLTEGTGRITRGISATGRAGAHWWAKHADAPFRFNSIAYEARKAGFDTPEKFRLLLDQLENPHAHNLDAAQAAKVDWVAKRANREGIAYDRLSDFEKRYITRAFWFYPWTAGATRFAVNTLLEHPYKSAALGNLGVQGRKTQALELGDLPSYEQGLVKLAGGKSNPLVSDFSTLSPFSTPGDLLQVPSVGSASSYLNPVYGALAQLAFRQNAYGQHSNHPLGDAISSVFSPTPEAQILNSYLKPSKPTAMFHKTPWNMLARAAAGAELPRRLNVTAGNKAAVRERAGR